MATVPFEILLTEDNPADARLMCELFPKDSQSLRMTTVKDGEEALTYLYRQGPHTQAPRPDLILLDLNLPRLDGKEFLRVLRSDPRFRAIPVIVLTTSQSEDDINDCYELGANCYLNKPHDLDELDALLQLVDSFWFKAVRLPRRR